jgi:hypothetical protein
VNVRISISLRILAVIALLSVAAYMSAQVTRTTPDLVPTGKGWGEAVDHSNGNNGNAGNGNPNKPGNQCTNGICYHGGPVMGGTIPIYYIWYGNWSGNTATTLLPTLVSDLSGSGYEHINTTYSITNGTLVSGAMTLAGTGFDSYSLGTALTDANIKSIVAAYAGATPDPKGIYFVLTSADVNETSGFCTQYCGWHTHGTINNVDVKYSFVGNPARCLSACADQSTSPNGNAGADGMASIIAHESEEAISDPDLNAWYDQRGAENADKCAWTFGTTSIAGNGSIYNFTGASGTNWLIQRNWVNAGGGYCSMSF